MDFSRDFWDRGLRKTQVPQGLKPAISNLLIAALKALRHPKVFRRG